MDPLYLSTSYKLSQVLTRNYSTSFSLGAGLFPPRCRNAIYGIYGFVRLADEIVDTFHEHDKEAMLRTFREETDKAIGSRISMNPILHAFQDVVHRYGIKREYIEAFLRSMEMDLTETSFDRERYAEYVYGSAEVIGLMCLQVFCENDPGVFEQQKEAARKLGAAFQKVNFLRDIKSDLEIRRRIYLPDVHKTDGMTDGHKQKLEAEIEKEFNAALKGIKQLPSSVRWGVYTAYLYYRVLFQKIRRTPIAVLKRRRVRVPNFYKTFLMCRALVEVRTWR